MSIVFRSKSSPVVGPRSRFQRNDERGLTTLEWLLIVAAVAGLAALAVVLVQNVVDDTAETISNSSARQTAATVAAQRVVDEAKRDALNNEDQPSHADTWGEWKKYYTERCERLAVIYSEAGITVTASFDTAGSLSYMLDGKKVNINRINTVDNPSLDPPDFPQVNGDNVGAIAHCRIQSQGDQSQ